MSFDLPLLTQAVADHGPVVRLLVTRTAGSVPRDAGTSMLVWASGQSGTIGGGALEFDGVTKARTLLTGDTLVRRATLPLGPGLGQCCGGSVSLVWERFDAETLPATLPFARPLDASGPLPARITALLARWQPGRAPALEQGWLIEGPPAHRRPLWVWGAGHVGRALVATLAPLPDFAVTWSDTAAHRFPETIPEGVTNVVAATPALLVARAPRHAEHLILTYSHDLDLALCHAILTHGFATAGLIGSVTKWARFRARLAALGHSPAHIARIACPIGDPALGKHPQALAIGVAAAMLASPGRTLTTEQTG